VRKLLILLFTALSLHAQLDPSLYRDLRWRSIGPYRGGRTVAGVGVPRQPNVFYIGATNGGVWKTTDAGRVWVPIFDDQPTNSIGALAVAPSDPNVLYAGSGEGLQRPDLSTGDGVYRSADAGRTWTHLGLRDAQQIPAIAVDPRDPNHLFVAALGHPYGPNAERGIFRSIDGGKTFDKVLFHDENTGAMDVVLDPATPDTVYAVLWEARQGPWENGSFNGPGSGLYKSTDGGTTWKPMTNGLPSFAQGLGRIGLEVCQADPHRLYAIVDAKAGGLYRSDDGAESWHLVSDFEGIWERGGDFNEVRADPKNPDVLYVANVVTWKSTDAGKTWKAFRGAPGGDDYHRLWINPIDPQIILNASDQGAIVTLNGGATWSSWYNQPTAQMYHVNADNAFPYRLCGGQQESGSACVQSRSDDGRITFREWHPAGVEEYGYAVPDPLDPDLVFGGKLERWDRRTNQSTVVTPKPLRGAGYRVVRTQPVVFSQADPHLLFFASNTVWKSSDRGDHWTEISPDLTRKTWSVPANVGKYAANAKVTQRGVVYALAPSPLDVNRLWAGTDDGLIHVTADGGKNWKDVTPPQLVPWAKVSIMEASHFDVNTAYAAVNTFRLDDLRPHLYRTRDGGATWSEIVNGIAAGAITNVVREDPKRRGLLYAGTETQVWVSLDDGEHWQSLRQNMPAQSIRDLIVKDDDLAVGTHGRGFWILDDVEPLRQLAPDAAAREAMLFKPQQAWRWRWSTNSDTPLPPDEPAGQNPPDGAIIDYALQSGAGQVVLEIADGGGNVIRRYSSDDPAVEPKDTGYIPGYWIRPQRPLPKDAGMHRVTWDLRLQPAGGKVSYPMSAVPFDTPPSPTAPLVMPGSYSVRLIVDGRPALTQPLTVKMDPRVTTPAAGLAQQFSLAKQVYDDVAQVSGALAALRAVRSQLTPLHDRFSTNAAYTTFSAKAEALETGTAGLDSLSRLDTALRTVFGALESADVAPPAATVGAAAETHRAAADLLARWKGVRGELPVLNKALGTTLKDVSN
jgi:photosystem II stability/assembly factor-like uncharacterized protein